MAEKTGVFGIIPEDAIIHKTGDYAEDMTLSIMKAAEDEGLLEDSE